MLMASLLAFASAQTSAPQTQTLPNMSHLAREAMSLPLEAVHTIEWRCSKAGKTSRAVVAVEDTEARTPRGTLTRNKFFKLQLRELSVEGQPAAPAIHTKVASAIKELNALIVFDGMCRNSTPGLLITGGTYDGVQRTPKRLLLELR